MASVTTAVELASDDDVVAAAFAPVLVVPARAGAAFGVALEELEDLNLDDAFFFTGRVLLFVVDVDARVRVRIGEHEADAFHRWPGGGVARLFEGAPRAGAVHVCLVRSVWRVRDFRVAPVHNLVPPADPLTELS